MNEVYKEIARRMAGGERFVIATVTSTKGSTPRKPGAKMIVLPDGKIMGTIGGGCGEAEVWSEAMEAVKTGRPRLVTVDLTNDIEGEDKICGGIMEIFVDPVGVGN
ncbi:MAG: XdhC family protein [Chloroflexi bacterium]|nr:XdhC family protein [Chloroflexota bacterium]